MSEGKTKREDSLDVLRTIIADMEGKVAELRPKVIELRRLQDDLDALKTTLSFLEKKLC